MIKLIEENGERLADLKIDTSDLNDAISQKIGVRTNIQYKGLKSSGSNRPNFEDDTNYADDCGIMSAVYSDVRLDTFGSSYNAENNYFWFSVHFSWEYIDGGSNGTTLVDVWYMIDTGKWRIRFAGERSVRDL